MSAVDTVKLFRPQAGDIIVVDFNKVNMTQVENAVADLKVPVIGVHDLATIKLVGLREQVDHSEQVASLQQELDKANTEKIRLAKMIQDDMVPKPKEAAHVKPAVENPVAPTPVANLVPKTQVQPVQPQPTQVPKPTTSPLPTPSTEVKNI